MPKSKTTLAVLAAKTGAFVTIFAALVAVFDPTTAFAFTLAAYAVLASS